MTRWIAALLLLAVSAGSRAATVCRITTGSFPFGTYDTLVAAPTTALFNIMVRCDRDGGPANVTVTLAAGPGNHATTPAARRMQHVTNPTVYLNYGLFTDGSYLVPVGSTAGVNTLGQNLFIRNKSSETATFTLHGRIPAQQNVWAGQYRDTVQVTVMP